MAVTYNFVFMAQISRDLSGAYITEIVVRSDKNGFTYVVFDREEPEKSEWHEIELRELLIKLEELFKGMIV